MGNIKGQIILEGDSGLGKSMFLRYLAKNQERIVVFLPASKCDSGVSIAIQAKLLGLTHALKLVVLYITS
jgi:DNA replicative helicase MCM subunit Mcm2 (Cdc46/Mcm family)